MSKTQNNSTCKDNHGEGNNNFGGFGPAETQRYDFSDYKDANLSNNLGGHRTEDHIVVNQNNE